MDEWTKEREAEIERLSEEAKKAAARERILRLANKRLVDEHAETARLDAMAADHNLAILRHNAKFHCRRRIVAEGRVLSARLVEEGLRADLLNESEARAKEHDELTAKVRAIAADYAVERARAEKAETKLRAVAIEEECLHCRAVLPDHTPICCIVHVAQEESFPTISKAYEQYVTREDTGGAPRAPLTEEEACGFYVQDSRSYVGNCVLWWAKGRSGYTTHLDDAHVFSAEEADDVHRNRETDIPIRVVVARAAASMQVDTQRLSRADIPAEVRADEPNRAAEIASLKQQISSLRAALADEREAHGRTKSEASRLSVLRGAQ